MASDVLFEVLLPAFVLGFEVPVCLCAVSVPHVDWVLVPLLDTSASSLNGHARVYTIPSSTTTTATTLLLTVLGFSC